MRGRVTQPDPLVTEIASVILKAVNLHHIPLSSITPETSLREQGLQLDSVDLLEAIVAIEHHFGFKVGSAEVGRKYFRTIGTIAEFIHQNRATVSP